MAGGEKAEGRRQNSEVRIQNSGASVAQWIKEDRFLASLFKRSIGSDSLTRSGF
jgi:hypothetical protein